MANNATDFVESKQRIPVVHSLTTRTRPSASGDMHFGGTHALNKLFWTVVVVDSGELRIRIDGFIVPPIQLSRSVVLQAVHWNCICHWSTCILLS